MPSYKVSTEDQNKRADVFLAAQTDLNRSSLKKLFATGQVQIDQTAIKAGYNLKTGEVIAVHLPKASIQEVKLDILYRDDDCVVINKPTGMLSHSKGAYLEEPTVASSLVPWLKDLGGERAGIVHRLDRATSGVMICARTKEAMKTLQRQFAKRTVVKRYHAITQGVPKPTEAVIDMPISRNPHKPQTFTTHLSGKSATTHYKVIEARNDKALVLLEPRTGRTHQLRVHLQKIGAPIVGDTIYGGPLADRLYLHASSLEITLPNKERRTFTVPLPPEFQEALETK